MNLNEKQTQTCSLLRKDQDILQMSPLEFVMKSQPSQNDFTISKSANKSAIDDYNMHSNIPHRLILYTLLSIYTFLLCYKTYLNEIFVSSGRLITNQVQ